MKLTLLTLAQIATQLLVIATIVFGLLRIREWNKAHFLAEATGLIQVIQRPDFHAAMGRVMTLPVGAEPKIVEDDLEHANAAFVVSHVFESLGVLVFYRLLPLHLVDHLIGGYLRESWRRLRPYFLARRTALGVMSGEWFQWLAERTEESPAAGKTAGAPIAHRAWSPT